MSLADRSWGRRRLRDPRAGATTRAAELLGTPVAVAVPLQRHAPRTVLAWCAAELASFALLVLTGSLAALAAVGVVGAVLLALAATNRRRVLAVTRMGVVLLSATLRGHAVSPEGPGPEDLALPPPRGVGAPVELADGRWWVDRSAYPRLRRAREALGEQAGATGGG